MTTKAAPEKYIKKALRETGGTKDSTWIEGALATGCIDHDSTGSTAGEDCGAAGQLHSVMIDGDQSNAALLPRASVHGDISFPVRIMIVLLIALIATILLAYHANGARESRAVKANGVTAPTPVP